MNDSYLQSTFFSGSLPATWEIATKSCFQIDMVDDTGGLADTGEVEDIVSGGWGLEEIQLLEDMGPALPSLQLAGKKEEVKVRSALHQ